MSAHPDENELNCLLWSGPAVLRSHELSFPLTCRVFDPSLTGRLLIECEGDPRCGTPLSDLQGSQLEIEGIREPLNVDAVLQSISFDGTSLLRLSVLRTPCWFARDPSRSSRASSLQAGRFVVINFGQYWIGNPFTLGFTLRASGWEASFLPLNEQTLELPSRHRGDQAFRATHQVEFRRESRATFSEDEAMDYLESLSLFLSFCHGGWVALALTVCVGASGEKELEQWGTGRVSVWQEPCGWLDKHHGTSIVDLYAKFYAKLDHEEWREAIGQVVYWFARADTKLVGPDGACILLQAALERLTWHVVVRDRRAMTDSAFNNDRKLSAADKIRLMLTFLAIPTEIPESLTMLRKLARVKNMEGPEVFTYVRNQLVHPPNQNSKSERLPVYEAYCLAQWYVELAILSACGYDGQYGNRTKMRRWVGEVEKVPWA